MVCPEGDTAKVIRETARLSGSKFTPAITDLVSTGIVEQVEILKENRHSDDGYRLAARRSGLSGNDRDKQPCPGGGVWSGTTPL
jgi:hypothetical protein